MTEVTLSLPDSLAQEAAAAGLITPQAIEAMLRERLRTQQFDELFVAMAKMAAVGEPPMTEAEICAEVRAVRAVRRARRP